MNQLLHTTEHYNVQLFIHAQLQLTMLVNEHPGGSDTQINITRRKAQPCDTITE